MHSACSEVFCDAQSWLHLKCVSMHKPFEPSMHTSGRSIHLDMQQQSFQLGNHQNVACSTCTQPNMYQKVRAVPMLTRPEMQKQAELYLACCHATIWGLQDGCSRDCRASRASLSLLLISLPASNMQSVFELPCTTTL